MFVLYSDDPAKCDAYWRDTGARKMFACYVLLGNIKVGLYAVVNIFSCIMVLLCIHICRLKVYQKKETDNTLLREPDGYDSVLVRHTHSHTHTHSHHTPLTGERDGAERIHHLLSLQSNACVRCRVLRPLSWSTHIPEPKH